MAKGTDGYYWDKLTKLTLPPNPIFPEPPMVKKGERVAFEMHYGPDGGRVLIGTVASVDTDEETGEVRIVLDPATVTDLEIG